jgi:hypothetical protein
MEFTKDECNFKVVPKGLGSYDSSTILVAASIKKDGRELGVFTDNAPNTDEGIEEAKEQLFLQLQEAVTQLGKDEGVEDEDK